MDTCDIYLIRHGETDWNALGKMQGHTDIALNMSGEKQALALKEKLIDIGFAAAYSSDLMRAKTTASLVVGKNGIKIEETTALREKSMGSWEGRFVYEYLNLLKEMKISSAHLSQEEYVSSRVQDDVESYAQVYSRLDAFIKSRIDAHFGNTILLFSHGGVLASVLYHIDFRPGFRWKVANCGYLKLRLTRARHLSLLESEGLSLDPDVIR